MYLDFKILLVQEDPTGKLYSMWAECFDQNNVQLFNKQWHNEPLARLLNMFRTWTLRCRAQCDNTSEALRQNADEPEQLDLPF